MRSQDQILLSSAEEADLLQNLKLVEVPGRMPSHLADGVSVRAMGLYNPNE